jgi:hypothetical protein
VGKRFDKTQTWTIEDDVPLPPPRGSAWPFVEMKPGQSVFLPGIKAEKARSGVTTACRKVKSAKFAVRREGDGCRVWRLA